MKVAIRTDASSQIGTGHLIRCLTLAKALRDLGADCIFICRDLHSIMSDIISTECFHVNVLQHTDCIHVDRNVHNSEPKHSHWLSTTSDIDAYQTISSLNNQIMDWLVVDHYALDEQWEVKIRPHFKKIMVIDDLADRQHDCDLLLDQNFGSSRVRYAGLVPAHCLQLHGPEYALMKPVYAERRAMMRQRRSAIQRVLIYFGGGSDQTDLTGQTVRAFDTEYLADIQLDVVVSSSYAHMPTLQALAKKRGNLSINSQLPDLAVLMAQADLAIGAGGATTWERCCMGLPSIVISIADNQRPACAALAQAGLIRYLGDMSFVTISKIQNEVRQLLQGPNQLSELSEASLKLVDGGGVSKVVEAIFSKSGADLSVAQTTNF